ncbi:MAG: SNF2 helicase associated domain-containing protein [Suipraeoptans sp.]
MKKRFRINREQVQREAGAAAYTRGATVYREHKVFDIYVDSTGTTDYIKALVEGSHYEEYEVFATYMLSENKLTQAYCSCPAYRKYSSICKHCVATLLEYEDYINEYDDDLEDETPYNHALQMLDSFKGNYKKEDKQDTTKAFKSLLVSEQSNEFLQGIEDINYGEVHIEPILNYTRTECFIEFKIGITRMYILKDLIEFEEHMAAKSEFSYGKELKFRHSIELFDEASKPIVGYILEWVRQHKDENKKVIYNYYRGFEYSHAKIRNLIPTQADTTRFFDAIGDNTFIGNIQGQSDTTWRAIEDNYRDNLLINGDSEGIKISVSSATQISTASWTFYFQAGIVYKVPESTFEKVTAFRDILYEQEGESIFVANEDIPSFIRTVLPKLLEVYDCTFSNFDPDSYGITPVTFEFYLDMPQADFLTFRVLAVYGEEKFNIYDKEETKSKEVEVTRDRIKEAQIAKVMDYYTNAYDEEKKLMVLTDDDDLMYEVLTIGVEKLQLIGEVFISDTLKQKEYSPKVTIGLSLAGEKLEISMTSEEMTNDELFEILSKYERKKKFYKLKNGGFVNMEDAGMKALLELKDGLGLRNSQLKRGKAQVPKFRALYLDNELREQNALPVIKDKSFRSLIRNMKTVEDNDFEIPQSLDKILRGYQKQGFYWLKTLSNNGFGGILADDMGLGKTLQVIAYILSEGGTTLVACPASLVFNWKNEVEKYAPSIDAVMVIGTKKERRDIIKNIEIGQVIITSYDLLKRDLDEYDSKTFATMVIDEAQFIKNHNTQVAKAVKDVDAGFKIALTGTPVENSLSELWSIFDFVMPGFFYNYTKFREEIETPIVQEQDADAKLRLQKMLKPFVLRRLKKDVLKDLPDKMEENYFAKLAGEQQKLYDGHVQRMKMLLEDKSDTEFKKSKIQILAELTKLRQLCCDPTLLFDEYKGESAKLEMCKDLVNKAISGGHKILLFSQFTSMLDIITKSFEEEGISYLLLTGATSKEKRAKMVTEFNAGKAEVFCISLKAGGTGLNLVAADIVIHYDPWWNVAVQNQATDRAHRIGQKNVVTVYKLIAKDTIEENIMKIQERKSKLADEILSGEGMSGTSFTKEELLELL